jgi:hypothetical protein
VCSSVEQEVVFSKQSIARHSRSSEGLSRIISTSTTVAFERGFPRTHIQHSGIRLP